MKNKIAFILPHYYKFYRGGAETQCFYLACELIQKGWEVHYIFEHPQLIDEKDEYGIHLHALPKRKGYFKWKNASALFDKMQQIKADVWYSRANISYLHYMVKFAKTSKGKVVWAFSRDSQFSLKDDEQKNASLPIKIYNKYNKKRFFKALRETSLILLQTKKQASLLSQNLNLEGEVIYNAHPVDHLENQSGQREKQVLWIGRMRPFKRPDRFIEIAALLSESDIKLKMIGKYAENDLEYLLSGTNGNIGKLEILGEKKAHEVHDMLSKSMLLVNTSEFEGFSNTFIEAWLRGVPVYSYKVDPDNMIVENDLGIVCSDLAQLAKLVNSICDNQDKWESLSKKCREHAFSNFNIIKAVDKLEALLDKV